MRDSWEIQSLLKKSGIVVTAMGDRPVRDKNVNAG